mgnify:CR=1 FL=1
MKENSLPQNNGDNQLVSAEIMGVIFESPTSRLTQASSHSAKTATKTKSAVSRYYTVQKNSSQSVTHLLWNLN